MIYVCLFLVFESLIRVCCVELTHVPFLSIICDIERMSINSLFFLLFHRNISLVLLLKSERSLVFFSFLSSWSLALVLLSEVLVVENIAYIYRAFLLYSFLALQVVFVSLVYILLLVKSFVRFIRNISMLISLERSIASCERSSGPLSFLILVRVVHAFKN